MRFDLSLISTPDLQLLADRLRGAPSVSRADLAAWGLGYVQVPEAATAELLAAAESALAERKKPETRVELIWTGPETTGSAARDTAVVVRALFAQARTSVLVAGFRFDHAASILLPLQEAVVQRAVDVSLFIDIPDPARAQEVLQSCWPFAPPLPKIYSDARASGSASMHAKCVVVDHSTALVTSANFTSRGQDRNIEVGALIHDRAFAGTLERHWLSAAVNGLFTRLR
jgi:phosphatidylserine/phosphatidylglycerophosphate/cardiolipin synthase-like enzyme